MDPATSYDVALAIGSRSESPQPPAPMAEVTMEPSVVPCDPYPPGMLLRETKQEVPSLEYDVKDNQPDAGGTLTSNMVGRISGSEHVMQPQSGERNSFISITPVISRATKVKPPPTWLPDDWYYEDIERKSGRSIGKIDRYYYQKGLNRKFRSMLEVLSYIKLQKEQTQCEMRKIKSTTSTNKGTCFPSIIQEIDATSCQTCKGMLIFPQGQTFYHIPIPKTGVMKVWDKTKGCHSDSFTNMIRVCDTSNVGSTSGVDIPSSSIKAENTWQGHHCHHSTSKETRN